MAVFLTVGIIQLITNPKASVGSVAFPFVVQMGLGIVFGLGFGKAMVLTLNRLKSYYEGIYPVFFWRWRHLPTLPPPRPEAAVSSLCT
ncbi:MAG: potassium/proton antiporter [Syntrophorhabdus sp. PtaU1.Bin153]|nr:MAG: potassium/proton antiporter [Syntrophorhabdus sp. PtaU1.Bin153]